MAVVTLADILCLSGSPLKAEARAAMAVVTLADIFQQVPIIIESDSKGLVEYIYKNISAQHRKIAPIISKINRSITLCERVVWIWIHHEANSAAHRYIMLPC